MLNTRSLYESHGFVHVPAVFDADTVARLKAEADRLLAERAQTRPWSGKWQHTVPEATTDKYTLRTVPDLQLHSPAFAEAARDPRLLAVVEALIGPCHLVAAMLIEKPPTTGQMFPLHQDSAYYAGSDPVYCVACLHLDATTPENGPLRFLAGHYTATLKHVSGGKAHLDPATYRIEDTVDVCAAAGDVICFSHHTPHGSRQNRSAHARSLVRFGYVPTAA